MRSLKILQKLKLHCLGLLLLTLVGTPALAAELAVTVDVPRLNVAEYHRPYVAIWLESDARDATNLAVWYDLKLKDREGEKWLKDMRQWWRRSGRALEMPVDGVTGATRAPGEHTLRFSSETSPLAQLPAGNYRLVVEAVREVGGREMLEIPFQWPLRAAQTLEAEGESELGTLRLQLKP